METRLAALAVPPSTSNLAAVLEDRHIRQLAVEARGPLREKSPGALQSYLAELGANAELAAADQTRVDSWLVNIALAYEYGDNHEKHEAAAKAAEAAVAAPGESEVIAANDPELTQLLAALGVQPAATATESLQAVIKVARQRPRAPAPPPVVPVVPAKRPAESSAAATSAAAPRTRRGSSAPLSGLSEGTFPLGFSTGGSDAMESASRVLRMLHVRELRRLQDEVNRSIVALQEFTANPKTDATLGRVGR